MIRTQKKAAMLALMFLALMPELAWAQSGIAGVVKDTSGAVLPGVTVEAASPVLIEKVRTAVTDGQGQYKIVDLRPGAYSVTFTLTGFNTFKREGIDLPAAFTATVNADLKVGAIEETVVVTGAAPLVDVQNSSQQKVLSQDLLESVPSSVRLPTDYTSFLPGVVSSSLTSLAGNQNTTTQTNLGVHGSSTGENNVAIEGITTRDIAGPGGTLYYVNQGYVQELAVSTGSATSEQQLSGPVENIVPKDGGNALKGQVYGHYTDTHLAGSNLTPALLAQGVTPNNSITKQWNFNPAVGGPIQKDKVWFFGSYLNGGNSSYAGIRYNATPTAWVYTPDLSRPIAVQTNVDRSAAARLTWQASLKNKISIFYDDQPKYWRNRTISATNAPEGSQWAPYSPQWISQFSWKSPVSNRLLLEVGVQYMHTVLGEGLNTPEHDPLLGQGTAPDPTAINATEDTTGISFRSTAPQGTFEGARSLRTRAAVSYVSGSHAVKVGTELDRGSIFVDNHYNGDYRVTLHNGLPVSLTEFAPAITNTNVSADWSLFAQDQWTVKRLTLNIGVRYDLLNVAVPVQNEPGNRFVPAHTYDAVTAVPKWTDISPRFGASYDVFGTGKTAVKATLNRYVGGVGLPLANVNPVSASILSANRTWTDTNRNFLPDCDFTNINANGECGRLSNTLFGQANPSATLFDPALRTGFGVRPFNWETSVAVQHEIRPGLAVNVGYFRRWFGNFTVQQNLLTTPADYSPYCLTVPVDSRLPGGGGNQICGFYDVSVAKFGLAQNLITSIDQPQFTGTEFTHFNGVDATVNLRFHGATVTGGSSTGRSEVNTCLVVNSPATISTALSSAFCDRKPPFQTTWKFLASVPLPLGFQASGTFASLPGPEISATTYVATNAQIKPTLGRDLSAGANGTVTLPLMAPGSIWGDRVTKLDARFTKIVRFNQHRVMGSVDVFNVFNSSDTLALSTRYGPTWLNPTAILGARYVRFAAQFDF